MNDIFDFINELKELQILYNSNDIRNYDFEIRIKKLERIVEKFEIQMFEEVDAWQHLLLYFDVTVKRCGLHTKTKFSDGLANH